jgi:lysophospholipase L1-like esterase
MTNMKILITALLLSVNGIALAQQEATIDSSYANSWYQLRTEFFKQLPDHKNEVVFLGNSITEQGEWQELVHKKHVLNRGISGDVTFGILARLDEILSSKPAKVFVLMGINDLKRGIPTEIIISNYLKLIKRVEASSPKTKLYIQSLLPLNMTMLPQSYNKLNNEKVNDVNAQLQALCTRYKITYVNLHPVFVDEKKELKKELSLDGLHLRSAAYIIWVDYLKKLKVL